MALDVKMVNFSSRAVFYSQKHSSNRTKESDQERYTEIRHKTMEYGNYKLLSWATVMMGNVVSIVVAPPADRSQITKPAHQQRSTKQSNNFNA